MYALLLLLAADPVADAATKRTVESVRVTVRVTETHPKFGPLVSHNTLTLAGPKARVDYRRPIRNVGGPVYRTDWVSVSDGTAARMLVPLGIGRDTRPKGFLGATAKCDHADWSMLVPVGFHFRPADPNVNPYPVSALAETDGFTDIGGAQCREYDAGGGMRVYLDAADGFALRRIVRTLGGAERSRLDVTYYTHPTAGRVPWEWTNTLAERNEPTFAAAVTQIELNPQLPADTFTVAFPPGAQVVDQATRIEYVVDAAGGLVAIPTPGDKRAAWTRAGMVVLPVGAAVLLLGWLGVRSLCRRRQRS